MYSPLKRIPPNQAQSDIGLTLICDCYQPLDAQYRAIFDAVLELLVILSEVIEAGIHADELKFNCSC